ncbi:hypothetical protein M408DRAFT_329218 [Serendipita vermifera MAFF 305830]|uniref:Uncharacterized protein n=1 Tax=Serendipita vermifera MAFF 305830 TaxID=933852 RepID=A0A0C3AW60_SERVB|nr:hypothetical protein M408DRAFT_329218 [Serendipita vermifera MAFF 305830]
MVIVAGSASQGHFRVNELALAEATLGLFIPRVCFIVGLVRKIRVMQAANAAGEEEVQKEIVKRAVNRSIIHSTVSTPQSVPTLMSHSIEGDVEPLYLGPSVHRARFGSSSTVSLQTAQKSFYGMPKTNSIMESTQDGFSTHSYA